MVEKAVIACAHSIISILKLRLAGNNSNTSYQRVRGHIIVLPQNLGPLLSFLPSLLLVLYNIIWRVWAEKQSYTIININLFTQVRKLQILNTLTWLRENNLFYKDIILNHALLDMWDKKFVPIGISSWIL